jgi:hypothetical protein
MKLVISVGIAMFMAALDWASTSSGIEHNG